jgi:hypothetical protein
MSSESACWVARSWVDVGSCHTRLVVRFMIFAASVRNILDTPWHSYSGTVAGNHSIENQTHFTLGNVFFPPENRAIYEIIWKNIVARGRPQGTVRRMPVSRWIPKATNTHPACVILMLFHCSNACLVVSSSFATFLIALLVSAVS